MRRKWRRQPRATPRDATAARIIAYLEPRPGAPRDVAALKRFVAGKLPLHMLPAEVRFVAALPRTASGKLDRRRLAEAERLPASAGTAAQARRATRCRPRSRTCSRQLLKIDGIGPDDDFFLLGGDSMMAAELQARIRETFGVNVDHLHRDATVAAIAAGIREGLAHSTSRTRAMPLLVPLWEHGRATPLFMVHGRHGQAYVSPHFMKLLGDDQPVWVFQARGLDGISEPHATIEAMVDDYVAEVRSVRPHGPYFLGGLCVGGFIAAAMARALAAAGETVLPLLMLDPPNRVRGRTEAHADPAHVAGKMRARHAAGKLSGPMDDPQYLEASVRTAAAFNDAPSRATRRRPTPAMSTCCRAGTGCSSPIPWTCARCSPAASSATRSAMRTATHSIRATRCSRARSSAASASFRRRRRPCSRAAARTTRRTCYFAKKRMGATRSTHDVSGTCAGSSMKSAAIRAPHGLNALTLWPMRGNSTQRAREPISDATCRL